MRRPEHRRGDRRDDRERVDDEHGARQRDRQSGDTRRRSTHDGHDDQHPLTATSIGERRQQRGQHCRRNHAHQPDQAECEGPAAGVGDDPERDGEGPFGRPRTEEAELRPTEIGVLPIARERGSGLAEPPRLPPTPMPRLYGLGVVMTRIRGSRAAERRGIRMVGVASTGGATGAGNS